MSRPLVFAHRGSSAALPEHTADAYLRAIEEQADGVECDVRLTRDGHLICIHDALVDRTSNGRGRVSTKTLAELDGLDFSSWNPAGRKITGVLTLDRLLDTIEGAKRPVRLLVETKHPSRFGGAVEQRLAELLNGRELTYTAVAVMSFSPLAIRRMRTLAPSIPTTFLFEMVPPSVREGRAPFGANVLGPGVNAVRARPDLVRRAQDRGHKVYVWTVNTDADIDLTIGLGVDGIITDRPAEVLARLGRG